MKDFVKIKETRFRKTTIKKYLPNGDKKLNIYFNTSRDKIESETFCFYSEVERDDVVDMLDLIFLL